jgi:hypothetical protein
MPYTNATKKKLVLILVTSKDDNKRATTQKKSKEVSKRTIQRWRCECESVNEIIHGEPYRKNYGKVLKSDKCLVTVTSFQQTASHPSSKVHDQMLGRKQQEERKV